VPVSPCGHPPGLRNIPVYLRRWLTRKLGAAFTSGGLKPGATEPPYTGGTLAEFSRASPTAGALANFQPVTLVSRGATIAEFLLALFPPFGVRPAKSVSNILSQTFLAPLSQVPSPPGILHDP